MPCFGERIGSFPGWCVWGPSRQLRLNRCQCCRRGKDGCRALAHSHSRGISWAPIGAEEQRATHATGRLQCWLMAEPWWKADRKQSRWTPSTGLVKRPKGIQHSQQLSTVPRASRGSNVLVIWTLCSARGFTAADSAAPLLCWAEGDPRPVYLGEGVSVEVWTAL